ncbi:TetR/AcrR family transcriptional regulator [Kyrpidia sp.]|uniref:TetR/AcrR family transcriptional regulator n=1 Tax=Kyrpidia sp. TaxID=2073077 RepID=UPI00258C0F8E|nr:TetR/AcrR family transcriptional regulator [Kyrpidia sp.]MCL6575892.1 TetR/AcrR family transcriptional regulator [Kyrpidia sp.]
MARRGRKEQILAVSERLFSEKGYHGTTIRDIAEASGILSGSLYAHIDSKEDLLFEIVNQGADNFLGALEPIIASPGNPEEKLRRGLAAHIRVVGEHLHAAKVFLHDWRALSDERRQIILEKRRRYEALWGALLEEGIQAGVFRPVHPKFAQLVILSVANWVYQWYDPEGPLGPDEIADQFARILLEGLNQSS